MSDTTLRRMVGAALILLFVYQATVMANAAAGGATAVLVAAVTFFCAQRAKAGVGMGNRLWFLLPVLLLWLTYAELRNRTRTLKAGSDPAPPAA